MKIQSPFEYNRWETDKHHLIWLPPEFYEWEGKKSVYITGSRGSGKTTLLKGFEWYERLYNSSLKDQIGSNPFEKGYIGVYLNIVDFITKHFINWPNKRENMDEAQWEEEKARLYVLYLECQILQVFIGAIQELRGKGLLKFLPEDELETVNEILSERPEINKWAKDGNDINRLNDLRLCFKYMHENLRKCAIYKIDSDKDLYSHLQMGKMLEEVTDMLVNLCSKGARTDDENEQLTKTWHLKACIDQSESPEPYQQKAINTMVARSGTGTVSFVVASLGGVDINGTYIPRHQLTDADRIHYPLDEIYGIDRNGLKRFHEFVTAVTELRVKIVTGESDIHVNLRKILGEWDINALLFPILKRTENPQLIALRKEAEKNMGIRFFDFKRKKLPLEQLETGSRENEEDIDELYDFLPDKVDIKIPPFCQTYLVNKLKLKLPHEESNKIKIRRQKSREIRKKMVAAMLCLCKEYKIQNIPYAGYYMVMSMSDTSIRDFLSQMHQIYLIEKATPKKFIETQVIPDKQNEAIHKASDKRYDGIKTETPYHISEVKNLVESLGKITAEIQSAYKDSSTLKSVEKGRFHLKFSSIKHKEDRKDLRKIIDIARDSNCIKILDNIDTSEEVLFRLHKLFAPHFKFSYRGAQYKASIDGKDLIKLCSETDDIEREKILNKIVSDLVKIDIAPLDRWVKDKND